MVPESGVDRECFSASIRFFPILQCSNIQKLDQNDIFQIPICHCVQFKTVQGVCRGRGFAVTVLVYISSQNFRFCSQTIFLVDSPYLRDYLVSSYDTQTGQILLYDICFHSHTVFFGEECEYR